ncbi:coiled-coil domain-containing protein 182 [Sceloporus undulatus]|uniref:coiled-coil domain-containing protein 182 n=1 Tax=Sceloporus undulatus TaxID=8520 RepID=UPI001C4AFEAB|nr:coiled-coil domain-containing protein 182 [Sceloporus undulatus]
METGEDFVFVEQEEGTQACEGQTPIPTEPPFGKANPKPPEQSQASRLSTLSVVCIQHSVDLANLYHDLKEVERETRHFQEDITNTLCTLESTLRALTELMTRLETRTRNVEQRLREEEDRGTARSKILAFLLSGEKELRKKYAILERMFLKKSAWLEGMIHKWTKT